MSDLDLECFPGHGYHHSLHVDNFESTPVSSVYPWTVAEPEWGWSSCQPGFHILSARVSCTHAITSILNWYALHYLYFLIILNRNSPVVPFLPKFQLFRRWQRFPRCQNGHRGNTGNQFQLARPIKSLFFWVALTQFAIWGKIYVTDPFFNESDWSINLQLGHLSVPCRETDGPISIRGWPGCD